MLTLKFYSDPGHAWVAVKVEKLHELNILHKVSSYSYIKGATAYLEGDCDASLLINTLREKSIEYTIVEKHSNASSPIRSYERFPSLVVA